jgi:ABC-2 type transport system permease protein
MDQVFHIINYKLVSFMKMNTDLKPVNILKNLGSAVVYVFFGIGVYFFTKSALSYLLEEIRIGTFLLHRFISVILFMFFMAVNAGNIIVSYSTLYKSKEVYYLITKPISFIKIFLIKFLDNFFYSSTTMLLMISAVMLGYSAYFKIDYFFVLFFFFWMLLPFMLIAASLGVILLMLMIRISFKTGLKKVIAGLILIYIIILLLFFKFSNPISVVEQVMAFYPNINSYFGSVDNPALKFLPNFWIADSLYWFSSGKPMNALHYTGLLLGTSFIFLIIVLFTAKKLYYKTWVESFELKLKNTRPKERANSKQIFNNKSLFPPQIDVLLKKEFLQFFREPGQWIHLSVIIFLIVIFITSLGGIDGSLLNGYNYSLRATIYVTIFSFNLFLVSSLSLRFAFPAVSLEGDAYWKLKSSPISMKKFLIIKFSILFSFIFLMGQGLNYFSHLTFPKPLYLISSINIGFITLAIVALNFGMGSLFVNLKEKSPIRIASSQGASLTFLFTIVLIVFLIALLFTPINNYYNDIFGFQERLKNIYFSSLIIVFVSLIISLISFILTRKALNQDI